MDIASKLKFILWCFVAGLWGLFMYQYIGGDMYMRTFSMRNSPIFAAHSSNSEPANFSTGQSSSVYSNTNYSYSAARSSVNATVLQVPKAKIKSKDPSAVLAISTVSAYDFNVPVSTIAFTSPSVKMEGLPAGISENIEKTSSLPAVPAGDYTIPNDTKQNRIKPLDKDISPEDYPEIPAGFAQKITRHFVLYEEGEVSEALEKFAERIHGNIMLDLVEFSPWTREKKVFIFYSHSKGSYQKLSGRPAWSGGSASLNERRIYLYASKDAYGILAHELTHMYFDSFFPPAHPSPLWLSEGMAVFIQADRARYTPQWLEDNIKRVKNGGGYKLEDLVRIDDLDGADENNIRLWYAQAYSLTTYLMKVKGSKAFYSFCDNLKNGFSIEQALSISYSQSIKSLEYAWRYSLTASK